MQLPMINLLTNFFLFTSFFLLPTVQADPSIGRIVKIVGEAKKENALMAVDQNLRNGDDVYVGDKIITGEKTFVKILLTDDTLFQLGPKTEFNVEKFAMRGPNDRDAIYNLTTGKLRSLFTQKNKDKSLILKTPTVSMGIRGTEILSDVFKHNGEMNTDIALLSGKLEISIPQINKEIKTLELLPGQIFEAVGKEGPKLNAEAMANVAKGIQSNIKQLPAQMMNDLKRPENQGGTVFLFDAYRKDLQNSGEVKFSEVTLSQVKLDPGKIDGKRADLLPPEKGKVGMPEHHRKHDMHPKIDKPNILPPPPPPPPPPIMHTEIKIEPPTLEPAPAPTPAPTAAPGGNPIGGGLGDGG